MHPLEGRLSERAAAAGLSLDDSLRGRLLAYFDLLLRWNTKINLTALTDPDEGIDRLLLEPVAAAASLSTSNGLVDLGSGGGSPAIPLALALHAPRLLMVESRGKKAAFLREAARAVGLTADVEAVRFEDLAGQRTYAGAFDVVSVRAVRLDPAAFTAAKTFLSLRGRIALFVSGGTAPELPTGLTVEARVPLLKSAELLRLIGTVPRETSYGKA
jgi:16S rRNA (guanine527-N7)-methyltransferase